MAAMWWLRLARGPLVVALALHAKGCVWDVLLVRRLLSYRPGTLIGGSAESLQVREPGPEPSRDTGPQRVAANWHSQEGSSETQCGSTWQIPAGACGSAHGAVTP